MLEEVQYFSNIFSSFVCIYYKEVLKCCGLKYLLGKSDTNCGDEVCRSPASTFVRDGTRGALQALEGDNQQAVTLGLEPKVTKANTFYLLDLHFYKDMYEEGNVQYGWARR